MKIASAAEIQMALMTAIEAEAKKYDVSVQAVLNVYVRKEDGSAVKDINDSIDVILRGAGVAA